MKTSLLQATLLIVLISTIFCQGSNVTDLGNNTAPANMTGNVTNQTNGSAPAPANMTGNVTNQTNGSAPAPANMTGNVTNQTNGSTPAINTTGNNVIMKGNVSFSAPPAINITSAGNFTVNGSGVSSELSKRPELLIASQIPAPANSNTTSTDFRISFFNSTLPNKFNTYNVTLPGTWDIWAKTDETLSCILIFDGTVFNTLTFNKQAGTFQRNAISASLTTDWNTMILNNRFILKENCIGWYVGGVLKAPAPANNTNGGNSTNSTNITSTINFNIPSGWIPITTTDSLAYGIANNTLYRLDPKTLNYSSIFTLNATADAYTFRSQPGRLILAASTRTNPTTNASAPVNVNQIIYIFGDGPNGTVKLLDRFNINSTLPTPANNNTNTSDPNRLIIPFLTSPTLGKLAVFFSPLSSNGTTLPRTAIIKSIDWAKGNVTNVNFTDSARFDATNARLRADNYDIVIGDNFAVIRNQSAYDNSTNATSVIIEESYQFVGNQLIFLRYRNLTAADRTAFKRFFIDGSSNSQLTIVTIIDNGNGFQFSTFNYGNMASVNKVVPPTIPAYLSFNIPPNTAFSRPVNGLGWIYKTVASNTTNSTYFRFTPNATSNVATAVENSVPGTWSVIDSTVNERCHVEKEASSSQYRLVLREPVTVSATNSTLRITAIALTSLLSGNATPITTSTRWFISPDCSRLAVAAKMLIINANRTGFISMSTTPVNFTAWELQMDTAILSSQQLWVVNPTLVPSNVYNFTNPLPSFQNLYRAGKRLLITATDGSTAKIFAYNVDNTTTPWTLTSVFNYSNPNFTVEPQIQVSEDISKVLVFGNSTPQPRFDGFFINYDAQEATNITFPFEKVPSPLTNYIQIFNNFLYIRGRVWNSTAPPIETILFIDKDVNPLQASRVNLTQNQVTNWKKSVFFPDPNGNFFFLVESQAGTSPNLQVSVMRNQVSVQQAMANSNTNSVPGAAPAVTINSNGQIKFCPPGCSECSSGSCAGCLTGWSYDSDTQICMRCGPGCLTCNSPNYQVCLTCIPSGYLTANNTCQPCDRTCLTCQTSATNCLSCPPGKTLAAGSCGGCPRNCITCSNSTTCTECQKGFVAAGGRCRGCSASCSSCNATNITQCTSCANGLYLSKSKCIPCGARCLTCSNSSSCSACVPGYTANSNGVCVLSCQSPCVTCVDNKPAQCLTCPAGSSLSGTTCLSDFTCSATQSCTDCGNGFNKILIAGVCQDCDSIDNCIQCSSAASSVCARCSNGYYVDSDSTCTACSANCNACTSSSLCTTCSDGYSLATGQDQGQCYACVSPCATCQGSPTYCLSCVDGYTKSSWKCQKNKYVQFKFTISGQPADFLSGVDNFVAALLTAIGQNSTNTDAITIATCVSGSAVVTGSVTPTNDSVSTSTTSSQISNALVSNTLGGFTIESGSLTTVGESQQKKNTSLIIGLVVGITLAVIIIIVIIVVVYKKKAAAAVIGTTSADSANVKEIELQDSRHDMKLNKKHLDIAEV